MESEQESLPSIINAAKLLNSSGILSLAALRIPCSLHNGIITSKNNG
jgi:hypothetical protein